MFEAPGWVSTSFDPTLGFPGEGPSASPVPQWRFDSTPSILPPASLPSPGSRWRRWAIGILQGTIPLHPNHSLTQLSTADDVHFCLLATRSGMTKTAILPMGRMETKGQIGVLKVHQHAVVTWLDRLRDKLSIVHLESCFALKQIELSVIGAQSKISILFRYREHRRFKIAKSKAFRAPLQLMLPTSVIITLDLGSICENWNPTFARPLA
jgi:hypothetical protein